MQNERDKLFHHPASPLFCAFLILINSNLRRRAKTPQKAARRAAAPVLALGWPSARSRALDLHDHRRTSSRRLRRHWDAFTSKLAEAPPRIHPRRRHVIGHFWYESKKRSCISSSFFLYLGSPKIFWMKRLVRVRAGCCPLHSRKKK